MPREIISQFKINTRKNNGIALSKSDTNNYRSVVFTADTTIAIFPTFRRRVIFDVEFDLYLQVVPVPNSTVRFLNPYFLDNPYYPLFPPVDRIPKRLIETTGDCRSYGVRDFIQREPKGFEIINRIGRELISGPTFSIYALLLDTGEDEEDLTFQISVLIDYNKALKDEEMRRNEEYSLSKPPVKEPYTKFINPEGMRKCVALNNLD